MTNQPSLYIIDDNPWTREVVKAVARGLNLAIRSAETGRQFFERYPGGDPAVIWLNVILPDQDALEIMTKLADAGSRDSIVLATGRAPLYLELASKLGALQGLDVTGTVHKPFTSGEARRALRNAAAHARAAAWPDYDMKMVG